MGRPPDCNCFCTTENPPPSLCSGSSMCPEFPGTFSDFQEGTKSRIIVIQICNTNSAQDDDMSIQLNGVTIDPYLDNSANARTGGIYVSDFLTTISDTDPLLLCQGEGHKQVKFNPTILNAEPDVNTLTSTLIQENFNGNYGELIIASYAYPYTAGDGCIILRSVWGDPGAWNYQFTLCEDPGPEIVPI